MVAAGLAFTTGKQTAREPLAVVGQQLVDPDREGLVQRLQKDLCTGCCLIGLKLHKHPSRSPVDDHKQVSAR